MSLPTIQRAIVVDGAGGPEVMQYRTDYIVPTPKEGQVLVKNHISGINYIDIYFREGLYPSPKPEVLGREAAGVIVAVGPNTDTHGLELGNRVIWLGTAGYSEYTAVAVAKTMKLPSGISDEQATASFLNGITCLALSHETYKVKPGDWALIHAAAGGVGFIMTQILKRIGAKVIGTTGGPDKVALVKSLGADHVIDYRSPEGKYWPEIVNSITGGRGVDVVFDSVGKDTWEGSLEAVKRKGTVIWFGNASGPVPPLPLNRLSPKCVKIARPTLLGYIHTREEFESYAQKLFDLILHDNLKINIHKVYSLDMVHQAHKDLEGRNTMGKLLLTVTEG
ncbi:hypothetical protein PENCOP_c003G08965 [Penicillium coprophilum]|uniref:Probable quinone oxidoreductase n=1 Tax=Penicillium coprophilum TaxID=36646 RepID=A0A1V6UYB5_9EURO|nr:hypothetical protein PENCOP_c003G08965 [Penicillium coprophilum]